MKSKCRILTALLAALATVSAGLSASALPYQSYIYDAYGTDSVYAPDAYAPSRVVNGVDLGVGDLNEPSDVAMDGEGNLYIVDSLNNRIVVVNGDLQLVRVMEKLTYQGRTERMNKPSNLFIARDGTLYLSDYGNKRVLVMDKNGDIEAVIGKPEADIYPQDKDFAPMDLVVTSTGVLYVLADGIYQGAVVFDHNHDFDGFFGSNQVEASFKVVASYFWKQIATKEQRDKMARFVPVQYSSLAIDDEDFVYATVASAQEPANRVRKLNPQGKNILSAADGAELAFGDPYIYYYKGQDTTPLLSGVDVAEDNIITVLDRKNKKVFQYSQEGKLVTVFGDEGRFDGTFSDPVALCAYGDKVVVLDGQKCSLTEFTITEYGRIIHKAIEVYSEGLYAESVEYWQEVLKFSSVNPLANLGYGKALYQTGDYKEAMEYFEKAQGKSQYSEAYKEYRKIHIREHFTLYACVIVTLLLAVFIIVKWKLYRPVIRRIRQRRGGSGS